MIEIGSGWSTVITAAAVTANAAEGHPCEFTVIDPYPNDLISGGRRHQPHHPEDDSGRAVWLNLNRSVRMTFSSSIPRTS